MASRKQQAQMREIRDNSGWEFMGAEQARAGDPEGFREIWKRNIEWLHDKADECNRMIDDYEEAQNV